MGNKTIALIVAVVAAVVVSVFAWFGVSIDQEVVEDAITEQVSQFALEDESVRLLQTGRVTRVIDGDTLTVQIGSVEETVRLIGIDAPESEFSPEGAECYGSEANDAVSELLRGATVRLESDPTQDLYDTYGRLLAYVQVGEADLGLQLIAGGFAREFTFRVPYERQAEYRLAQESAQAAGVGLWAECTDDRF